MGNRYWGPLIFLLYHYYRVGGPPILWYIIVYYGVPIGVILGLCLSTAGHAARTTLNPEP